MKVKIFSQKQSMWTAAIVPTILEQEVNQGWLPIREVKHDVTGGFWSMTQFVISIYYSDPNESDANVA